MADGTGYWHAIIVFVESLTEMLYMPIPSASILSLKLVHLVVTSQNELCGPKIFSVLTKYCHDCGHQPLNPDFLTVVMNIITIKRYSWQQVTNPKHEHF